MLERMKKLQEYLNGPESKMFLGWRSGRHFTGSITLVEDGRPGTLYFEKGHVARVEEEIPATGIDLGIDLTKRIWDAFPSKKRSMFIINLTYGRDPECKNLGDVTRMRQFNHTVAQVCRLYSYVREGKELWYDLPARDPEAPASAGSVPVRGFYLRVNGIKVYVETNDAPDDKATIVCLHTAGRDTRQYHDMMEIFKNKYRMYALDMPSHGKSWPLPGNEVIRDHQTFGKWIWDVTQALGVKNPIFIGCSYSGGIVYHMAQEYHPVRAVVCMQGCDNTATPDVGNTIELLNHPGSNPALTQIETSDSLMGEKTRQSRIDFIRWGVQCEVGIVKQGDYMETMTYNVSDKMDKITCPVRIIQGLDDLAYNVKMAEGSMQRLVNCKDKKLIPVEGYGHFIAVENPEIVCEVLDELIQTL